ncbi:MULTISPECIES: GNAT family N-acetyltransferase [Bifidobacterium]|jgi:putative acetyltransferase|uniref:N-acetyltransferase n=1 Tax=Bifidobacterium tibiigranuli TaxID=2172043 RepID=A0A5N6S7Y7_9BIFI|nr:GNAT family N-acetyltransferase [Bifidobacterium tibiigranuli]KAE8129594.1 N-acetyltransferase [Bifidobacterium tibiigranuli]KAE8129959.1 GNAT family N-acetyltransferase [Bifidobacterium tibiigranuli]MCH3975687.1 GNAT family N-acetyltransferase [Bifidobacterium tibiigranuli]MCH4190362.1 GNAT family N-acetyltransferase [Bifidobacterium tibiigranuli]MCH4202972.1 GNAT family N-acetyltransferase [Bifidobacterium tibiigranuli]
MRIRSIEAADDAAVAAIVRTSLHAAGLDIPGTAYFDPQLDRLAEYYGAQENRHYWVAEEDSRVVGGVGIAPVAGAEGVCELQKLYVDAAYRGRGYSKALIDTALPFAAQYFDRCYLETHSVLGVAGELYRSYGFAFLDGPLPGGEHSAMNRWAIKDLGDLRADAA